MHEQWQPAAAHRRVDAGVGRGHGPREAAAAGRHGRQPGAGLGGLLRGRLPPGGAERVCVAAPHEASFLCFCFVSSV